MINSSVRDYIKFVRRVGHSQRDNWRRLRGARILYCIGDSHIGLFIELNRQHLLRRTILRCKRVGAATAMGLANPNSTTKALQIYEEYICSISRRDYLLFMLGEVDCGYLIWSQASKYQLSVDSQLDKSLAIYQDFILKVHKTGYKKIILASVPLPTIMDMQVWGGKVGDARQTVTASLRERTDITFRYNEDSLVLSPT